MMKVHSTADRPAEPSTQVRFRKVPTVTGISMWDITNGSGYNICFFNADILSAFF